MPSGPLRRALRAAGHHLDPVLHVGKEGVTDAVRRALDAQLLAHELVKVKVGGESLADRFEAAALLGGSGGAQVGQVLGRTVLVYRRHPEKPRFEPAAGTVASVRTRVRTPARKGGKRTPRKRGASGGRRRGP